VISGRYASPRSLAVSSFTDAAGKALGALAVVTGSASWSSSGAGMKPLLSGRRASRGASSWGINPRRRVQIA
jgi:hypothetical protein